jgi:hypothetical protein
LIAGGLRGSEPGSGVIFAENSSLKTIIKQVKIKMTVFINHGTIYAGFIRSLLAGLKTDVP